MMLANQLITVFQDLAATIRETEVERIDEVAAIAAASIAAGGSVYIHDRGHLLNFELFHRAGGLALLKSLPMQAAAAGSGAAGEAAAGAKTARESGLQPGDILIIGSVSGRAAGIIELAAEARKLGIVTVALTAIDYASQTPSQHPSGQRLHEVCEYVLDIHTVKGDASLDVEGMDEKVLPTSGIASALVCWCFVAQLIEHLLKGGRMPSVFRSVSMPGGQAQIDATLQRFQELGY